MTDLNLFSGIPTTKPEDLTTEVLAYLLRKFDTCRADFLFLIDPDSSAGDFDVGTQHGTHEEDGDVDLVLHDSRKQWIVYVENKPWYYSTLTQGSKTKIPYDQLKRYVKDLAGHPEMKDISKKTLCLLATKENRNNLLQQAASAEGINATESALKDHYKKCGVDFIVITWDQVFAKLEESHSENTIPGFLIRELHRYFPSFHELSADLLCEEKEIQKRWADVTEVVKQAKEFLKLNSNFSGFYHSSAPQGYFLKGYFIVDNTNGMTYWFGARLDLRRYFLKKGTDALFGIQVRFKSEQSAFRNTNNGVPVIDPEILDRCGFCYDPPTRLAREPYFEYVAPLSLNTTGSSSTVKELADGFTAIVKAVNEAISGEKASV